jgi:hypothetical protein
MGKAIRKMNNGQNSLGGSLTIGVQGSTSGPYNTNPNTFSINTLPAFSWQNLTLPGIERIDMNPFVTISLVRAHGGVIVVCRKDPGVEPEYHIIPDTKKNFDRELGKIISYLVLKG